MNKALHLGLAGRFRLTATKPDGTQRIVADWFDNLITDAGLNRLGTGGIATHCQVGTGSTTPNVLDTALAAKLADTTATATAITYGSSGSAPWYGWVRKEFRFAAGVAAGTIAEVGIGWAATGSLWSRALVVDGSGNPTTITILSDEVLDILYEIRVYPPTTDFVSTLSLSGVEYAYTMRPSLISAQEWGPQSILSSGFGNGATFDFRGCSGPMGTITTSPSGTFAPSNNTSVTEAYVSGSLKRVNNWSFALGDQNIVGGIRSAQVSRPFMLGYWQCEFVPNIPKTSAKVMTLKTSISWGRRA